MGTAVALFVSARISELIAKGFHRKEENTHFRDEELGVLCLCNLNIPFETRQSFSQNCFGDDMVCKVQ